MGKGNIKVNCHLSCDLNSLKSMTVGKGNKWAAILYTCENQMGKGREWDCLFILGWDMEFELNFC